MATLLYKRTRSALGSIEFDCTISETHEGAVDVTEFPVEDGFDIADHARPRAETVTMEAFVSNTPIPFDAEQADQSLASYPYSRGVVEWNSKSQLLMEQVGEVDPATRAYNEISRIKNAGELVTLTTSLRTYEDMLITSVSVPRSAAVGNGLQFTVSLKELRIVNAQVERFVVAEDKAKKKQDLSKKATEDQGLRESKLRTTFNGLKSTLGAFIQ